jgi:hypothetical protein
MPDELKEVLVPIEKALPGARIVDLPDGESWVGAFILVKTQDKSGQFGWSARRTEGLTHEELLGLLAVHTDMFRDRALFQR